MLAIVLIMENDFKHARLKLISVYLLIVFGVVTLFSVLTIYQADNTFTDPVVPGTTEIAVTAKEAQSIAERLRSDAFVVETEYEIENNVLYFTTTFSDETEVKVNLFTTEVYVPKEEPGVISTFVDDFEEKVVWVALFVFVLASLLSVYVANQTLVPIVQNMRKQKEFISGAAHELRNPLAALHARLESALLLGSTGIDTGMVQELLTETQRLILLSEGLLSLEKAEVWAAQVEEVAVMPVVESLLVRLAEFTKKKNLTITTEIKTDTVRIDPRDLEVILFNLVHNAIKFTPENGKIHIVWDGKSLTVSDTGIGISKENSEHIFDRFYKVDTSRGGEGSGLGLALVKAVLEKYSGKIQVNSIEGKGTTFVVTF